jgi:hypothetical protein
MHRQLTCAQIVEGAGGGGRGAADCGDSQWPACCSAVVVAMTALPKGQPCPASRSFLGWSLGSHRRPERAGRSCPAAKEKFCHKVREVARTRVRLPTDEHPLVLARCTLARAVGTISMLLTPGFSTTWPKSMSRVASLETTNDLTTALVPSGIAPSACPREPMDRSDRSPALSRTWFPRVDRVHVRRRSRIGIGLHAGEPGC